MRNKESLPVTPELILVVSMLREGEGLKLTAYPDAGGLSIGYGHHLQPGESTRTITSSRAEQLLLQDANAAWAAAGKVLGYNNPQGRIVYTCMVYQLGVAGAKAHTETISHLLAGEYKLAGAEMHNSKWFTQTPKRVLMLERYLNSSR